MYIKRIILLSSAAALLFCGAAGAQTLTLRLKEAQKDVSPMLYGLMTEEINYAYEGGLYAQLVRDPQVKELVQPQRGQSGPVRPRYWELSDPDGATMTLRQNEAHVNYRNNSLLVEARRSGAALLNRGFWGMAVRPATTYQGSLYAKGAGSLTVSLVSTDGGTVYASQRVSGLGADWRKFEFRLATGAAFAPTKDAMLRIAFDAPGTYQLTRVMLFPPSYKGHGLRSDLMELMAGMKPAFLRFPGGNYLEGNTFHERFDWKRTIGDVNFRPGHQCPWGYWSSDGLGLLEFLTWIEDLGGEPILGVFAGYTLNRDYVEGEYLEPFIQDALDEIEYVIGGPETKWGGQRVRDGHPAPFKLHYVEIGNEDFFDRSGSYQGRYMQFYKAIKAKYPQLQIIASTSEQQFYDGGVMDRRDLQLDIVDEHYYRNTLGMYRAAFQYDSYDRNGPKVFCGEWASREGEPTTNLNAALGDAAWMACMERNSDHVIASCYAPLFVNVSEGAMQWRSDLLGYDALSAYGSPSYYAQCLFAQYLGDKILPVSAEGIPTFTADDREGGELPQIYYTATMDSKSGRIYLKLVNAVGTPQTVKLAFDGKRPVRDIKKVEIAADDPLATNSIDAPTAVVPVESVVRLRKGAVTLSPYSITVLEF
ncbi:MAG: alpha-N-arabinofuranosidase [Bacteroidales bacterium]|nr:alpha-N-arabinofuranosidase [Bacteroidales bacterium]MBR3652570.1 alpha-N-arabinofuranosidase [Bacteroidales bacterium]